MALCETTENKNFSKHNLKYDLYSPTALIQQIMKVLNRSQNSAKTLDQELSKIFHLRPNNLYSFANHAPSSNLV